MNAGVEQPKSRGALRIGKLAILAAVAALFILAMQMMADGMLYPAPGIGVGAPPGGFQDVQLSWGSGHQAAGWFHPGEEGRPVILYFHGNGENLETMRLSGLLYTWREFGFPLLAVDYPGYGRSTGKASEANILQAADAAVQWIAAHQGHPGWIAAGWSLGAAVAVQSAARNPDHCKTVIVMSGWSSLQDAAASHFPGWLTRLLLRDRYDSVAAAGHIHCPALVIHGVDDSLIPIGSGQKLANAFPKAKWIALPAGHNDLPSHPELRNAVQRFLNEQTEMQPRRL